MLPCSSAEVAPCSLIADHEDETSHSSLWLELWRLHCTSFAPIWVCDLAYLARLVSPDNWWKFSSCSDWLRVTGAWTYCVWGVVMTGSAEKGTCTLLYCCQTPDCSTWELGAAQCRQDSLESLHGERLFVLAYWPLYSGSRPVQIASHRGVIQESLVCTARHPTLMWNSQVFDSSTEEYRCLFQLNLSWQHLRHSMFMLQSHATNRCS